MNHSRIQNQIRRAQRDAQRKMQQEVDRVNRENQRKVDEHNRRVIAANQKAIDEHNRKVREHNRRAERHNQNVTGAINRHLNAPRQIQVAYRPNEQGLVDRVRESINFDDGKEYDVFISYARIDGYRVASELKERLETLDVSVWFDEVSIVPGKSQSLQMDAGLRKARTGIAVLTPAYLAGRFWTQRELGALLSKSTLIPVLSGVSFDDVKEYSGILPDLAGFSVEHDDLGVIAEKIAPVIRA